MGIKNFTNRIGFVLVSLLLFTFYSCVDCRYDYQFTIENKTSSNISVFYLSHSTIPSTDTTITLHKDSFKSILFLSGGLGGCEGPDEDFGMNVIDSINITMNDTMQTKIDYQDYKNWGFSNINDLGFYTITLIDSDFVKK